MSVQTYGCISPYGNNLIFCWIKSWRQRQLHFPTIIHHMKNYNLSFPFPFQMAMYHTLNAVIFWVLERSSVPLSDSCHSELLKSSLWSDLFKDLPLFSVYLWGFLCIQEFWQRRWSNTRGINLMGLHRCYWLLFLDWACSHKGDWTHMILIS